MRDMDDADALLDSTFETSSGFDGPKKLAWTLRRNGVKRSEALIRTLKLVRSVRSFLLSEKRVGRTLRPELMYDLLIDYLKHDCLIRDVKRSRASERRAFLETHGLRHRKFQKVVPAKSHYRSELVFTLMYEPGCIAEQARPDRIFVPKGKAAFIVAEWLILLGDDIGAGGGHTESERIEVAAKSVLRAFNRWNILQAPNKPRGVYRKQVRLQGRSKHLVFTTREKDIQQHVWW